MRDVEMRQGCDKCSNYSTEKKHCTAGEHRKDLILVNYSVTRDTMESHQFHMDKAKDSLAGVDCTMGGNEGRGSQNSDVDKDRDNQLGIDIAKAGHDGYLTGEKGNMTGEKGNLTGEKGNMTGDMGNMTGKKGNMPGDMGNIAGEKGNLTGEKGNFRGEKENMTGEKGNMPGENGNMTREKSNFTGDKGNMTGEKGNMPGENGNMTREKGNMTGEKGNMPGEKGNFTGEKGNIAGEIDNMIPLIDLLLEGDTERCDGEWETASKGGGSHSDSDSDSAGDDSDEDSDASDDSDDSCDGNYEQSDKDVFDCMSAVSFGENGKFNARKEFRTLSETESTDSTTPRNSPRRSWTESDSRSFINRQRISSTETTSTITPSHSQHELEQIPMTVPKFIKDIVPKIVSSPSSVDLSVGSTLPSECFSTDLSEDGVCRSYRVCPEFHNVQYGTARDLEHFVKNKVYDAEANTGFLLNADDGGELEPNQQDKQSFYREGVEYTVLPQKKLTSSIVLCQDESSGVKFIRKERQRAKFQGQKKSVLVPLRHQSSSYIMDIYGVIVMEDVVYILMEYCQGGSIKHSRAWSTSDTSECVLHILKSLVYMHTHGLVHGDIKPENICLRVENDMTSLCLIDFEYVRIPEEQPLLKGHTTQYLPPWWKEMGSDRELLTTMDLWATACIAVCLLSGKSSPWSRIVKMIKKACNKCEKICSCDKLHAKLRLQIQEQGSTLLEEHLDSSLRGRLQADPAGRALWQTLVFLTTRTAGAGLRGASAAMDILTGVAAAPEKKEIKIQKIDVKVMYKKRVLAQVQVDCGTLVEQVLQHPDVSGKLDKKLILWKPRRDHFILNPCNILMYKDKKSGSVLHGLKKIQKKLSKTFWKEKRD